MRTKFFIGAIACVLLAGCGGTSGGPIPVGPTLSLTPVAPVIQTTGTTAGAVPVSNKPQMITVTNSLGQQIQVSLPAGQSLTAGEAVVVTPGQLPIYVSPSGAASAVPVSRQANGNPSILLNGTPTGFFLSTGGVVVDSTNTDVTNFALPAPTIATEYTIAISGVQFGSGSKILNVGVFNAKWVIGLVNGKAQSTEPTGVVGIIPANNGTTEGADCTATFMTQATTGASEGPPTGTLTIGWGSVTKFNTASLVGDSITFVDPGESNVNDQIPSTGIDTMTVDFSSGL